MKIYLDTSIISALFDERNPERKILTEEFFQQIDLYQVFISTLTLLEIENTPNYILKEKMQNAVSRFQVLSLQPTVEKLSNDYISHGAIPHSYAEDAYHIAIAVANDMDYLLSWNFRHLVRNKTRDIVRMVNTLNQMKHIEIVTPAELM
ncbi:MAG: PIN domain-containing protein [Ignavibacteriae bacterium]|nr:PIN domain-containing protein [Ignavibacteriota bacterium]